MIKKLLSFLLAVVGITSIHAQGLPQASTDGNDVWYLIQFAEGGFVFDGETDNSDLRNEKTTGTDAQFWKFTGNEQEGYTLTNKKGYSIYVENVGNKKQAKTKVSSDPGKAALFKIVQTTNDVHRGTFELLPVMNTSLGLNLAGGTQWRNGLVGAWDKGDINNCLTFIAQKEFDKTGQYAIIPYPQQLKEIKEGALNFATLSTISCPNDSMTQHLEDFATQLKQVSGISLKVVKGEGQADHAIQMSVDQRLPAEGYTLKVNDNGIAITASHTAGFFYALQTLKQMLPNAFFEKKMNKDIAWEVPYLDITDQPELGHRGFMLDVARHFFTKEEVMRILDVMAFYKMNIFHWHLTEDQGWRIEIPEYPRLTEVGSIRKASFSNPGEGGAFWDDTEYGRGMWYTQQDLKEVVAYAQKRNINIIPEVDFPGHMVAAVTAYPEFSCDPRKIYEVRVASGISNDVLNIGNDKVIDFLKCIMDNLAQIFPYKYIHFGGDECPTDQWSTNEECLKRVRDNHLNGVNELQSWLIEELGTYVKEKYNKDIMVWDELTKHWNKNNKIKPVVMCWHNNNNIAADLGLKSVTCPHDYTYLDMMQIEKDKALIDEPYRGGWSDDKVTTVQKTYSLDPNYKTQNRKDFVVGVQANMWTETTNDRYELEYQVFPRLIATAEVGWLPVGSKDWNSFYKRLQKQDKALEANDIHYAKHFFLPKEVSDQEATLNAAREMLEGSVRGGVGYPQAEIYDALAKALKDAEAEKAGDAELTALKAAVQTYRTAAIRQPEAGKIYQIFSASTYYKKQFAGSSLYQTQNGLRIHYTPQVEPEELWEFLPTEGGYLMQNVGSRKQVALKEMNKAVALEGNGTAIRIDKATKATANYSYIPGVVTISAVAGYNANSTGNVKRLVAQVSGDVNTADDVALCYPGTWKFVEVTDFKVQLQGLCDKCENTLRRANPFQVGDPTPEALLFLQEQVLPLVKEDLKGKVTEEMYREHQDRYNKFLAMPRIGFFDSVNEGCYYLIQNAYFTDFYAAANGQNVAVRKVGQDDQFYWQLIKNTDGTLSLLNKANNMFAFYKTAGDQAPVTFQASQENARWTPEFIRTDQNQSGMAITDKSNTFSWYAWADRNTSVANVNFRPKDWGASIWNFIRTNAAVPTGIEGVKADASATHYYDLSGRRVICPSKGTYIQSDGKKIYVK